MPSAIFNETQPIADWTHLDAANGTGYIQIVNHPLDNSRIDHCWITNEDSIDHVVNLCFDNTGHVFQFASINIPARAGFDTSLPVDLIPLLETPPIDGIVLPIGFNAGIQLSVTMTGATVMAVLFSGGLL